MWSIGRRAAFQALLILIVAFLIGCGNGGESESEAPAARFSASPASGDADLSVQFTDESTGEITSWAWDFDGDGTTDSTQQNPEYTYDTAGDYTVILTVTGPGGSDTQTKVEQVTVEAASQTADFVATPASGSAPLEVQFTDNSTGEITTWAWDFGDSVTTDSTKQNPKHTYAAVGKYTVTLTVTGPGGSDKETKYSCIEVSAGPEMKVGDATLISTEKGVALVEAGGWKLLDTLAGLPSNDVDVISVDGEGRIWVGHGEGISVLDGRQWTHYDDALFGYRSFAAIDFAGDNSTWAAASYGDIYVLRNGEWKSHDAAELGLSENASVRDLAVDASGHVWVATSAGVSRFDGSAWTSYDESSGLGYKYIDTIAADLDGGVWVGYSSGASHFDGSHWRNYGSYGADFKVDGLYSVKDMAVDGEGRVWMTTYSSGVYVFDGDDWKTYTPKNSGLIGGHGQAIACDGHGRVWVGTSYELAVFDGSEWTTYTEATSGLPADGVSGVSCKGTGPASLPGTEGTGVGSASGSVTLNGSPAAGVKVSICWDVSWPIFTGPTPCDGEVYQGITDAEGRFSITGIPIGLYQFAVYLPADDKWHVYGHLGPGDVLVISGEDTSLGLIPLTSS